MLCNLYQKSDGPLTKNIMESDGYVYHLDIAITDSPFVGTFPKPTVFKNTHEKEIFWLSILICERYEKIRIFYSCIL